MWPTIVLQSPLVAGVRGLASMATSAKPRALFAFLACAEVTVTFLPKAPGGGANLLRAAKGEA